jgi:HprK-related kinase B
MFMQIEPHQLATEWLSKAPTILEPIFLALPDAYYAIHVSDDALRSELAHYFRSVVVSRSTDAVPSSPVPIYVIDSPDFSWDADWENWQREPGKSGRKDAYLNINGGRVLYKVRTGMVFLQSMSSKVAIGPAKANVNQVINFINNQYMNHLQQHGWLICHAAALTWKDNGIAIAGFSGGGKSTSMLHLMADDETRFVSNDRLFVKRIDGKVMMRGVPKMPRVNPGTLLNNPKLLPLLTNEEQARYNSLAKSELWDLERKYDVDIESVYGIGRIVYDAELTHFVVLNWSHQYTSPMQLEAVNSDDLAQQVAPIEKSPGPFYQNESGVFLTDPTPPATSRYVDFLENIRVLRTTGQADFAGLFHQLGERLFQHGKGT